jgi:hypothetical protein
MQARVNEAQARTIEELKRTIEELEQAAELRTLRQAAGGELPQ